MVRSVLPLLFAFLLIAPVAMAPVAIADPSSDPRMVEHALGNPKAPVRIDEYYSLDCPHCAAFVTETLPELQKTYIDTGKVYLVLHDFPLHDLAVKATMLARCAPSDRFIPMVETLFKLQRSWLLQTMAASMDGLKQQAKFAGMTGDQIDSCLADRGLEDAIYKERLDAEKAINIQATPTFIFNQKNDDRLEEAGPFSDFQKKIDTLLKK
jgi:protein-disulfide isomerase